MAGLCTFLLEAAPVTALELWCGIVYPAAMSQIHFTLPVQSEDLADVRRRFEAKIAKSDGCWLWQGSLDHRGYGRFRWNWPRSVLRAHRAAYALYVCLPAMDTLICHSCDNPACVRPDHLFAGSAKDNTADMIGKGRWVRPNFAKGERSGRTKLTAADVLAIRADSRSYKQIAAAYGISKGGVSHIRARRVWAHI